MEQNELPGGEQSDDTEGRHKAIGLDARQRRVFEALTDVHAELGRMYLGAVRVLADPLNPAMAYLAAHVAREICNRLEYFGVSAGDTRRQRRAILLELDPDDPVVKHWHEVCGRLTNCAHLRSPEQEPPKLEDVVRDLHELEEVLLALLRPFYELFPDLDELLSVDVPTEKDVQKLLTLLARPGKARRAYFFDNLEKPSWLGPLREAGFFANPPEPVQNKEEGTITFRRWPESRYLAKMAEHEPQMVHDIILEIL